VSVKFHLRIPSGFMCRTPHATLRRVLTSSHGDLCSQRGCKLWTRIVKDRGFGVYNFTDIRWVLFLSRMRKARRAYDRSYGHMVPAYLTALTDGEERNIRFQHSTFGDYAALSDSHATH